MLRRLGPDEVEVVKALRLGALAESPSAFGSTLADAQQLTDDDWRGRLHPNRFPTFVWDVDGEAVGMAVAAWDDDDPTLGHLYGMWVRPSARGTGAADALVGAVLSWATARGLVAVQLHVTDGNVAAERLYERHGFRRTGVSERRDRDGADEVEMVLVLAAS